MSLIDTGCATIQNYTVNVCVCYKKPAFIVGWSLPLLLLISLLTPYYG